MSKNLLVINCDIRETRVALIEGGIIAEFHIERANQEKCLGDVVLGKVSRVLPGMQAAFIDVGLDKAAFLHVEDLIRPDDFEGYLTGRRKTERTDDDETPSEDDVPQKAAQSSGERAERPREGRHEQRGDRGDRERKEQAPREPRPEGADPAAPPAGGGRRRQRLDSAKTAARPQLPPSADVPADIPPPAGSGVVVPPPAHSVVVEMPPAPTASVNTAQVLQAAHVAAEASLAHPVAPRVEKIHAHVEPASEAAPVVVVAPPPPPPSSLIVAVPPLPAPTMVDLPLPPPAVAAPHVEPAAAKTNDADADAEGDENEDDLSDDEGTKTEGDAKQDPARRSGRRSRRRRRGRKDEAKADAPAVPATPAPAPAAPQTRDARSDRGHRNERHDRGGQDRSDRGDRGDRGGRRGDRSENSHVSHGHSHGRIDKHTPIREVVREGQEVLVQITKEPIGTKGARVSSHVSLPGRYVVYLPTVEYVGVSKRIGSEKERQRLREAIDSMRPPSGGLIVRTVAEGLTKKQLKQDVGYLVRLWGEIAKMKESAKGASLLYKELDLVLKVARDMFTDDIEQIVIDDRAQYERLVRFVEMFMPERVKDVLFYQGDEPIFDAYGIEEEISRSLARKVPLPSGGYLIIDEAEALTAIDVNTGRFVGKGSKDHEDTIVKTNMEAVQEIAYQLRFRNLGGLIVLDLIDMERPSSREAVRRRLEDLLQKDKAKTSLNRISDLGLIEMTRKRTSESLGRVLHEPCFYCDGTGQISSKTTVCYEILRSIRRERASLAGYTIVVNAHPEVVSLMKGEERQAVQECEKRFLRKIELVPRKEYHLEQFDLLGR